MAKKVSLIIPVYNEAPHLVRFLDMIDILDLGIPKELIIVNDASKDNSKEILDSYKFKGDSKIFHQPVNQGKGAAIRRGISEASGDYICVQDADFEYDSGDLPRLLKPLVENKADVVYGSRFRKDCQQVHRTFHYLVNRILTLLSNLTSGLYLSDMETCYKIFRAEIIKNIELESNRFGFEPEITAKVARLKVRVVELPISYFPRNYMEGKKITWRDGIAALRHIVYFNLFASSTKNYKETLPKVYIPSGRQFL